MLSYKAYSNCLNFIFPLAFLLLFQAASAQDFDNIEATVDRQKNLFGGKMAVMIWKDTVVFQKFAGEDMAMNTQVPIGSAGTLLTAALTMVFVEQGKISLDDPVAKYLPIYEKYAKSYLTIRHCLANVTGLQPEKGGIEKYFQKTKFETLEDQVNAFASSREILNNPAEAFNYNNIGTSIAARVLEVVGRKTFDRLMAERIFRPLGMKRSTFGSESAVNPFAGGVSTPLDFLKFMAMLINDGNGNGRKILSSESISEIFKIQTGEAKIQSVPRETEGWNFGLGNWIDPENSGLHIIPGFSGAWPFLNTKKKYACMVFAVPKDRKDKDDKALRVYREIVEDVDAGL